jgi:putative ABC transport system permease protein
MRCGCDGLSSSEASATSGSLHAGREGATGSVRTRIAALTRVIAWFMATLASLRGLVSRRRIDAEMLRLFLRHGLVVVAIGIAAGLAAAAAAAKSLATLVFGVTVTDPITPGSVAALLTAVTLLACYLPARSATHLDPVTALRSQ